MVRKIIFILTLIILISVNIAYMKENINIDHVTNTMTIETDNYLPVGSVKNVIIKTPSESNTFNTIKNETENKEENSNDKSSWSVVAIVLLCLLVIAIIMFKLIYDIISI